MSLPNLIVIGAMKAATTSLHYYLNLHPEVAMSNEKELCFFSKRKWNRGVEWYSSQFNAKAKIRGETSPAYTNFPFERDVPKRMHSVVPTAKLLYVVRDPIDRLISHYIHRVARGKEARSFEEALSELRDNPYIVCTQYFMQLQQFLQFYRETSILVFTQEDLRDHTRDTMKKIFQFLEVNDSFHSDRFNTIKHESAGKRKGNGIGRILAKATEKLPYSIRPKVDWVFSLQFSKTITRPSISESSKQRIIDYLQDDIDGLRRFTTYKFEDWCL